MNDMKPIKSFEDLLVFQRAYKISLEIHKVSLTFPKYEQFGFADQIRRASKSVCANIAEGFAKQRASGADFKRFLMIAVASCDEVRVWLRYALDLGYINDTTWKTWRDQYHEISKMLLGLHKSWK